MNRKQRANFSEINLTQTCTELRRSRCRGAERKSKIAFLVTFFVSLVIYLLTMPHDLTWANFGGDGGELITASVTLGVPHPSGYPTYILLGKLFSFLPFGTIAWRYHLFSATAVSLATAILTITIYRLNARVQRRRGNSDMAVALASGLLFAFTPLVWGQAIIAEVYALNLLLVALLLWALLTQQSPLLVGLLLGLAITTHLTSLVFVPLVVLLLHKREWSALASVSSATTRFSKLVAGLLLGLSPFLLIPLFAQGDSPVIWGNPTTQRNWWTLVSGAIYRPNQFAFTHIDFLAKTEQWVSQLGWAFLLFLLITPLLSRISSPHPLQSSSPRLPLAITAVFLILYAFLYNTNDSIVLILPALFIIYLLFAPSLMLLEGFALALPLLYLLLNFSAMDLRNDDGIRPYAEDLLATAPPHAILQTNGDPALFSLWYFHFIEGQRSDIAIVDYHLFGFDWYRQQLPLIYPDLAVPVTDDLTKLQQDNAEKRPFCNVDIIIENNKTTPINSCLEDNT